MLNVSDSGLKIDDRKVPQDDNHREIEAEFSRLKALDAKGSKVDIRELVIANLCFTWGMFADEVAEVVDDYLRDAEYNQMQARRREIHRQLQRPWEHDIDDAQSESLHKELKNLTKRMTELVIPTVGGSNQSLTSI